MRSLAISDHDATIAVQRYLDELAEGSSSELVIRALLDRAAGRLWQLCAALLQRSYPRLTRPPLNLQVDEMLSAVVERLMKAMREARPTNVRQFFGLASQHMRWELNDMARRLDERPVPSACTKRRTPSSCSRPAVVSAVITCEATKGAANGLTSVRRSRVMQSFGIQMRVRIVRSR
jgi:RNA polymerase sigma-70 factor (ECF subfamily)